MRFIVRDGAGTREEQRVPGEGVPFRDRWEHDGALVSGPEMVVIPPGEFLMGSPPDEPGRMVGIDLPQRLERIAQAFAVGRYAVTFYEWDFAQADSDWRQITGIEPRKPADEGWGRGNRPVINLSWDDAQAYLKWLRTKTGQDYRLLSEAEWEYAARAGTVTPFWWGSSITLDQANYRGNRVYNDGEKSEYRKKTVPVDAFAPNPFGLYQVHGNVWEWVEDKDTWEWFSDIYDESYDGAPADSSAETARDVGRRVIRGGSWEEVPLGLRAAVRLRFTPDLRSDDIGFRLARALNL